MPKGAQPGNQLEFALPADKCTPKSKKDKNTDKSSAAPTGPLTEKDRRAQFVEAIKSYDWAKAEKLASTQDVSARRLAKGHAVMGGAGVGREIRAGGGPGCALIVCWCMPPARSLHLPCRSEMIPAT